MLYGCSSSIIPDYLEIEEEMVKNELLAFLNNDNYSISDIQITQVCAVIPESEEDFQNIYRFDWQLSDAPTPDYGGYYRHYIDVDSYDIVNDAHILSFKEYSDIGCFKEES